MAYMGCHMYNENDDEIIKPATDVFEINDFTAATDWENFIDDIENVLRNWKVCYPAREVNELDKSDFMKYNWKCRKERLSFYEFPFVLYHYVLNTDPEAGTPEPDDSTANITSQEDTESVVAVDLMSSAADFCPKGPKPALLFGLREVLVLCPGGDDTLGNDTRAKMVVGAVNIALHNTGCPLPTLVQVMDTRKELYNGSCIASNTRLEMSSISLNKRPSHCTHLSGLLELYRTKINYPLPVEVGPARVSIRLSYQLEDWASHAWMIDPPDLDLFSMSGDTDFVQLRNLPFGCVSDPVSGLTLHCTWRDMSEDLITDSAVHTDLEPLEAPEWSVEISLLEHPDCLLAKHLDTLQKLCVDTRTVRQLLGELMDEDISGTDSGLDKVPNVLDKMSGGVAVPSYSFSDLGQSVTQLGRRGSPTGGPLKPALLKFVLGYLFPDSEQSSQQVYDYPNQEDMDALPHHLIKYMELYQGVKTAPMDSLVWRLSTAVACCLQWAGAAGVAHLWHEVCLEIRYRWEGGILLPGLPPGLPDSAHSILVQKLQMVNCCTARKVARDRGSEVREVVTHAEREEEEAIAENIGDNSDTDYDEDEEFFECEEEQKSEEEKKTDLPAWSQPEGRAGRVGELRLLSVSDWLYRPEVQEPAPLTEDQLAEQAEVMMQLGSDQAGTEVRAKMQSANLLSDMESFKAANPGSVLADFVRWHSPRDWEDGKGLSHRMKSEGNIWAGLWEQARAVPARRQRRLFDDTREAEKVVTFLTGLNPGDLAQILLPTLLQAGHYRLLEACHDDSMVDLHMEMVKLVVRISKLQCLPEVKHYKGVVENQDFDKRRQVANQLSQLFWLAEMRISQSLSLRKKFVYDLAVLSVSDQERPDAVKEMEKFVCSLGSGVEVRVLGAARGPAGRLIQNMFRESQQDEYPRDEGLPPPSTKQFIIRSLAPRPFPFSRPVPQRMYARLGQGEFRIAGCFTVDRQYS